MARTVLEVFLSSTAADLKPHREAVYARLARIEFFKCIRQEDFGAQNAEAIHYCCDKAHVADLFVGLIGMRRGWEPHGDNTQRSITEMEYDSAREAGRARYLWVSPDDFAVPGNLRESDAEHERQLGFRKRVMAGGERIVSQKGFDTPNDLAAEIVQQLLTNVITGDLIKHLRADLGPAGALTTIEDQKPAIAAAVEKLAEDKEINLLALARNPKDVSIPELEAKLKERADQEESAGHQRLKTSAEYWRHIGALAFLHDTKKALAAYQKATTLDPTQHEGWGRLGELHFRLGDLSAAEESFDSAIRTAKQANNQGVEAHGHVWKSWLHYAQGRLADAQANAESGLELANLAGSKFTMASAYGNLGAIHLTRGELDKAEDMQRKAIALAEELAVKEGMARGYSNLGIIHRTRGELDKAEEMQRKALALDEELGSKEGTAADYGNLGNIHQKRGELDKAEEMHRKALALNEELGRKAGTAVNYGNLGIIHGTRGELDEAENMHRKALALNEELGGKQGMALAYANLANIYDSKKRNSKMCECWKKARDLWREMGLNDKAAEIEAWMKRKGCPDA